MTAPPLAGTAGYSVVTSAFRGLAQGLGFGTTRPRPGGHGRYLVTSSGHRRQMMSPSQLDGRGSTSLCDPMATVGKSTMPIINDQSARLPSLDNGESLARAGSRQVQDVLRGRRR